MCCINHQKGQLTFAIAAESVFAVLLQLALDSTLRCKGRMGAF